MKYLEKYYSSILSILLLLFANITLWPGSDCDVPFASIRYLGLLAYFIFFLLSLVAWGSTLQKALPTEEKSPVLSLGIGSIWISATTGIFLFLHCVGEKYQLFFVLFLFLGILLADSLALPIIPFKAIRQKRSLSAWALVFFLLLRLAQSTIPWSSTDPLFYHLLAPKLWLEESKFHFIPNMPMLMQASFWEHLYLALFQGIFWQVGRGLIEAQIIAQWFHCVVGYFGSALLLRRLLENTFASSAGWINLAVLAAIFCADLYWTSQTAKNDWGICFWTFSGFLFLPIFRQKREWGRTEIVLSACFLGFAMGAKYSAAITIFPILGISSYFASSVEGWKVSIRKHFSILLLASLPVGILLFRNFDLTGAPLFPAFTEHFKEVTISKTSIELFGYGFSNHNKSFFALLLFYAQNIVSFSEKCYLPLLLVPLFLGAKKEHRKLPLLAVAFCSILFVYSLANLNVMRYLGPALPLCAAFSVMTISLLPIGKEGARSLQLFLFVFILWRSDFFSTDHYGADLIGDHPLSRAVSDLWTEPNATVQIRQFHLAGNSKAWLRQNLKAEEYVVLSAENLTYYLPGRQAYAGFEDTALDDEARKANSLLDLLPSLRAHKIRYILNTQQWVLAPRIALSILSTKTAQEFPKSVVFRDKDSQIIDLTILAALAKK